MNPRVLVPETLVSEALAMLAAALEEADVEDARLEARHLLMAALGVDLAGLILRESQPLGAAAATANALLARRSAHEPLSRILGRRAFHGLDLALNAATLDPRPDTETLVEAVLAHVAAEVRAEAPLRILDLGTGTGAILLALLTQLPQATGLGVDIADEAVHMAAENARHHGLEARAAFRCGDLMAGLADRFDILVSNPPYIPSGEIAGLEPEVRFHDPHLALDGGADGLDFYRRILASLEGNLVPGGLLAFEVGFGQAEAVAGMLAADFTEIAIRRDLGGIERVVTGRMAGG